LILGELLLVDCLVRITVSRSSTSSYPWMKSLDIVNAFLFVLHVICFHSTDSDNFFFFFPILWLLYVLCTLVYRPLACLMNLLIANLFCFFFADRISTGITVADIDFSLIDSVRAKIPIAKVNSTLFNSRIRDWLKVNDYLRQLK